MDLLKHATRLISLGFLTFGVMTGSPTVASAAEQEAREVEDDQNLVIAQGYGEIRVRPDSLRTTVGVEARALTLDQARGEVNTRVQQVIASLKALGIPGASLQTQALLVYPIYSTEEGRSSQITGYSATNQVTVTVLGSDPTDLGEQASRIIDGAIQSGANTVGNVSFFLRDPAPATDKALAAAMQSATQRAQAIAGAARVKITQLHSVVEAPSDDIGFRYVRASAEAGAATPIETGEIVVSSRVTARFTFKQ